MRGVVVGLFAALALLATTAVRAEYCATGPIRGQECTGFGIEVCESIRIDAVAGPDGELYTVRQCYEEVSDYDDNQGRCWITTKSRGAGLLSWVVDLVRGRPKFFHRNDAGEYEAVDAEYVTFECIQR